MRNSPDRRTERGIFCRGPANIHPLPVPVTGYSFIALRFYHTHVQNCICNGSAKKQVGLPKTWSLLDLLSGTSKRVFAFSVLLLNYSRCGNVHMILCSTFVVIHCNGSFLPSTALSTQSNPSPEYLLCKKPYQVKQITVNEQKLVSL